MPLHWTGISYLSRSQESALKDRIGNLVPSKCVEQSSSGLSVADAIFVGRIKARIKHWTTAIKDTGPKRR